MIPTDRTLKWLAWAVFKRPFAFLLISFDNDTWPVKRVLRDYPKRYLPIRLARAVLLLFVFLVGLALALGMAQGAIGLGFEASAGSVDFRLFAMFFVGLIFASLFWVVAALAAWHLLTRLEQHLLSGKWVAPRV